jgi:hypothetical protein
VLRPVLQHMDIHSMWTPPDFAQHVFQIIVFSIAQEKTSSFQAYGTV